MILRVDAYATAAVTNDTNSHSRETPTWHSATDHTQIRRFMISRLQRLHPALQNRRPSAATSSSQLVQRIELMLFKSAYSIEEYMNECSLERRVHALVTQFNCGIPQSTRDSYNTHTVVGYKRACPITVPYPMESQASFQTPTAECTSGTAKWSNLISSLIQSPRKKARKSVDFHSKNMEHCAFMEDGRQQFFETEHNIAISTSHLMNFSENTDIFQHIFNYLEGLDIWRTRGINHHFSQHAPLMISSLTIDAGCDRTRLLQGRFGSVLYACKKLKTLLIKNTRNDGYKTGFTRIFPSNVDQKPGEKSSMAQSQLVGSSLVMELAAVFRSNALEKLTRLELVAPYDCAAEGDATVLCISALASKPTQFPHLKHLRLESNILGDERICVIAHLLEAPFFQKLKSLILRNNFMGEAASHALWTTFYNTSRTYPHTDNIAYHLQNLDCSRNILTDGAVLRLAALMKVEKDVLQRLQKLQLEENFIGSLGFQSIANAFAIRNKAEKVRLDRPILIECERNCIPVDHVREFVE